jgi:putative nucleotidyltransferase with HDIG domain
VDHLVDKARVCAASALSAALPRRWQHVQAVAAKAESVSVVVPDSERQILVAAAWLHDIGYAPSLVDTGFHPLDGARWLRAHGCDERVVRMVANHSAAIVEADLRGLGGQLAAEFPHTSSVLTDALWYADLTTGPDGQTLTIGGRLDEIRSRYGPDDIVTAFTVQAEPRLVAAVQRTEALLYNAAQPM